MKKLVSLVAIVVPAMTIAGSSTAAVPDASSSLVDGKIPDSEMAQSN